MNVAAVNSAGCADEIVLGRFLAVVGEDEPFHARGGCHGGSLRTGTVAALTEFFVAREERRLAQEEIAAGGRVRSRGRRGRYRPNRSARSHCVRTGSDEGT